MFCLTEKEMASAGVLVNGLGEDEDLEDDEDDYDNGGRHEDRDHPNLPIS
jgi:hypothetical protein